MGDLRTRLIEAALAEGFALAEVLDVDAVLQDPEGRFARSVSAYDAWITRGDQGEMAYLARGRDRRADPRLVYPEAKSALCVAIPYPASPAGSLDAAHGARYARYLQGPDYHEDLKARLARAIGRVASLHPGLEGKPCVDTSAVLERTWCALAGLGWIGKNTMLIHPQLGSYLFLAVAFLNQPGGIAPKPHPDYCGSCSRCLDACPTQAFSAPRALDSRKCVSYLTLEKRGEPSPSETAGIGNWIAGCDLCQEVCPFNRKAARSASASPEPGATRLAHWSELLLESEEEYRERIQDSSLARIKWRDFQRNLAIAIRSAPERDAPAIRELLEQKARFASEPWLAQLWREALSPLTPT